MLSDEVRKTAGLAPDALPATEVAIRGRTEPLVVRTAGTAGALAAALTAAAASG